MKASDLIKNLTNLVSVYGDHDLKIHIEKYGDTLSFYEYSSIDFEYNEISKHFVADIEVFGF